MMMDNTKARTKKPHIPLLISGLAIILSILACARSDVPPPRGIGSGGFQPTNISTPEQLEAIVQVAPTEAPPAEPTETISPQAPEPVLSPTFPATPTNSLASSGETIVYRAGAGDTLRSVAARFGVLPEDITSPDAVLPDEESLI
jgi:hypothetical protein